MQGTDGVRQGLVRGSRRVERLGAASSSTRARPRPTMPCSCAPPPLPSLRARNCASPLRLSQQHGPHKTTPGGPRKVRRIGIWEAVCCAAEGNSGRGGRVGFRGSTVGSRECGDRMSRSQSDDGFGVVAIRHRPDCIRSPRLPAPPLSLTPPSSATASASFLDFRFCHVSESGECGCSVYHTTSMIS